MPKEPCLLVSAEKDLCIKVYGQRMTKDGTLEPFPVLHLFEIDSELIQKHGIVDLLVSVEKTPRAGKGPS